jgi:hypothetical protein
LLCYTYHWWQRIYCVIDIVRIEPGLVQDGTVCHVNFNQYCTMYHTWRLEIVCSNECQDSQLAQVWLLGNRFKARYCIREPGSQDPYIEGHFYCSTLEQSRLNFFRHILLEISN